jgi:hypothetical protein
MWAERVALMEKKECAYKVLVGNRRERDYFEDLGIDERIILKRISKEQGDT